jgi:hypothetical protein
MFPTVNCRTVSGFFRDCFDVEESPEGMLKGRIYTLEFKDKSSSEVNLFYYCNLNKPNEHLIILFIMKTTI